MYSFAKLTLCLLLLTYMTLMVYSTPLYSNQLRSQASRTILKRHRRQFDLSIAAEHDEKAEETEVILEAIANLWRSEDSKTQIEGSAKVVHQTNSLQSGNTRYTAKLHLHHDYKRK